MVAPQAVQESENALEKPEARHAGFRSVEQDANRARRIAVCRVVQLPGARHPWHISRNGSG